MPQHEKRRTGDDLEEKKSRGTIGWKKNPHRPKEETLEHLIIKRISKREKNKEGGGRKNPYWDKAIPKEKRKNRIAKGTRLPILPKKREKQQQGEKREFFLWDKGGRRKGMLFPRIGRKSRVTGRKGLNGVGGETVHSYEGDGEMDGNQGGHGFGREDGTGRKVAHSHGKRRGARRV